MDQDEWKDCEDPWPMMKHLLSMSYTPSKRKTRLFVCGVVRIMEGYNPMNPERAAVVEACEKVANGLSCQWGKGDRALKKAERSIDVVWGWTWLACQPDKHLNRGIESTFRQMRGNAGSFYRQEEVAQLLRDTFGDPFSKIQTSGKSKWLPDIVSMAQAVYEERAGDATLDALRLSILADALEENNSPPNHQIIQQLRCGLQLYRGTWSIDLILGRE